MEPVKSTINDRIKILRKALKISQTLFGEKIGVTCAAVSNMEISKSAVTESKIKLICSVFGVSENWLRLGKGKMFVEAVDIKRDALLLEHFHRLSPAGQDMVIEYVRNLISWQGMQEVTAKNTGKKDIPSSSA